MKKYFDSTIFANPLYEYIKWLVIKIYYQTTYWGKHLRIGYKVYVRRTKFGKYNYIGRNVFIADSELGDFSYVTNDSTIVNTTIGKFCSIGPNVKLAPGRHPTGKIVSTHPSIFSNPSFIKKNFASKNIFEGNERVGIGNDVWVGANCLVIDGVTIADGAIIAANSVVTKNVGAYCIVGGVPAKLIRKRFEDDEIEKLMALKWWDKDEEWIQQNITSFWDIKDMVKL